MVALASETIWLWIGTIGMTLGTLYFATRGRSVHGSERETYHVITIFVAAIAAVAYFTMAAGFGRLTVPILGLGTTEIQWVRYADWLLTTPLLVLALAMLAGANRNAIATLIGLDVLVILTRLAGALAREAQGARVVWWAISCGILIVFFYLLLGDVSTQASRRPDEVTSLFVRLRNLTVVLWAMYPVVWILGSGGAFAVVSGFTEAAAFLLLDLGAKVGFGVILLRGCDVLDPFESPDVLTTTD